MHKTAVGLLESAEHVDDVIREIEALGFPRNEVRALAEPAIFEGTGVMSFPRLDFEVDLRRELIRMGATKSEVEAYVDGLRRGGALIFATASDGDKKVKADVEAAAAVMNRHGAVGIEETTSAEPYLPRAARESMTLTGDRSVTAGRIRQPGGGACCFVW
jgi:hypothetical protein